MRWNRKRRALLQDFEQRIGEQLTELQDRVVDSVEGALKQQRSAMSVAVTAAWVTGALAVLAGGLYAGKEIRSRYKVKRRTPYDYYAHAGDRRRRQADLEFGVGI